jgi:Cytochrome C'
VNNRRLKLAMGLAFLVVFAAFAGGLLAQDPPEEPTVSTFAPVKDLLAQKDAFMARLDEALTSSDDYSESMQNRVLRDGATIGVILQGLALTDEDNPLKAAAPALRSSVDALVKSNTDYAAAKAALDKLKSGMENPQAADGKLTWDDHVDLGQIMKQVSTSNSRVRRGMSASRFDASLDDSSQNAALIALIARSILSDTHHATNDDEKAEWYKYADTMRDAAGKIHAAVAAKDQEAALAAYTAMTENCTACHDKFRQEEDEEDED